MACTATVQTVSPERYSAGRVPVKVLGGWRLMKNALPARAKDRTATGSQFPIPQFMLLDFEMPRMTGFEFLVWLRQEPELKHLPVIALTGSLNPADAVHAY